MKERVFGIISFIIAMGWGLFVVFIVVKEGIDNSDVLLITSSVIIGSITTILYIIGTKFGRSSKSELEMIEYDNQILKKRIEQQELLKKLER